MNQAWMNEFLSALWGFDFSLSTFSFLASDFGESKSKTRKEKGTEVKVRGAVPFLA